MTDPYDWPGWTWETNASRPPPEPSPDLYPQFGTITEAWFRGWVERSFWRFAVTMPWVPHWYSHQDDSATRREFERAVVYVRRHGRIEPWPPTSAKPRWHVYLYDEASCSKFWTMGEPLAECILINRVPLWVPSSVRPPKKRSERPTSRPPFDPDRPAPTPRADPPPPRPPITPGQLTLGGRALTARPCVVCSREFSATRTDARYCSGSCRTAAHRVRVAEREAQITV